MRYALGSGSLNAGVGHPSATDAETESGAKIDTATDTATDTADDKATEVAADDGTTVDDLTDDSTDDPSDDPAELVADDGTPRRPRFAALTWLLPALTVVALLLAGVVGGLYYRQHGRDTARNAAVTAARQVLINAYSVDYRSVTKDYQRFVDGTSGDLHSQLTDGRSKFIQTVQTTHTHETAQIVDAGVVRSDSNSATIAIALNSPLTTTSITKPQTRSYRTEVDVALVHGTWLATAIRQAD
jgi:Mce-associated membrane protein